MDKETRALLESLDEMEKLALECEEEPVWLASLRSLKETILTTESYRQKLADLNAQISEIDAQMIEMAKGKGV